MQSTLERLRQRREEMGDEGGFTLIELLIVIVILGILAAIVVFAVQNLTSQSDVAACQAQYKTVETAMEAYKAQTGAYPNPNPPASQTFHQLQTQQTGLDGSLDGPWLRDLPPEGTVSAAVPAVVTPVAPSTTTSSPYYLTIDTATSGPNVGAVMVGTVKANGAKADSASADGVGNCSHLTS